MTTETIETIATVSNAEALKLHGMVERKLRRKLRSYQMTMQTADVEDITADALLASLELLAKKPPAAARHIHGAVYLSVHRTIVNWIERQCCHASHLVPFPDYRSSDLGIENDRDALTSGQYRQAIDYAPDNQPTEDKLPRYVAGLCESIDELKAAIVLSGCTFDGRIFLEMSNELASAELNCSIRQVQRYKATLRKRFALFTPEAMRATSSLVTPA